MILNKNIFGVYFLLFFNSILLAQEEETIIIDSTKTDILEEVFITGTRTLRQLSSLPLPAQIVTKKEIRNINSLRLNDLLNEQTGLITVMDHGEGIQMQGLDSDYTLIMIDGVPLVGRTAGVFDLNRITVGNIKQIEIVKGASSSLYGSEALAGVINIITENPKEGFMGDVDFRGGTYSTNNTSTNINYKKNKFGIWVFANRYENDGYDLDKSDDLKTVDPYTNYTFNIKTTYDFSDATTLLLSTRYYTEDQVSIPNELLKGENNTNEWNTHLKLDHKHNKKWSSYFEFYATNYKVDSYLNNPDNTLNSASDFDQLLVRPEMRITYDPSEKHSFIGGIGWTHETLDRTFFSNKPEFNAPYAFLQYDANPTEKLNIILGARFDNHSEYQSQFSPKVALRYEFNKTIAVKTSVGYGFKAPDFRQLYLDFTNPSAGYTVIGYNRVADVLTRMEREGLIDNISIPISEFDGKLKAENSLSFNFGFQLKPVSEIDIEVNLFRNDIRDLIDTQVIARKTGGGQNVFSYQNISRVYTQGVELNTAWNPTNRLKISGGYQLLFAKDKDAEKAFENGEVFAKQSADSPAFKLKKTDYFGLLNRSRHMANTKVFYNIPQWDANTNIRVIYRSDYGLRDTNSNAYIDSYDDFVKGYAMVDFAINKTFYKNYLLGFGIDNLLDFTDTQNISSIPGRLIYGQLNIQF